jgi:malonate-semialdehyde dehydrogenase (acetylating)/methylmalonate-semialdehyde dehydrogenase
VFDPNTGDVQARVQLATEAEVDRAVQAAQAAFAGWSQTNPQRRARVLFEFKRLVEADMENLARLLSSEHGKVIADSKGDIQRGLEVIEFACGIPHALKGEYTLGAGPGIDVYSMRVPLGVSAGITPFNFPAMIPMWMFGVSIAAGNTFVLKPSERDPSVPVRLGELMMEAGAPEGVLNVVHGDKTAVDAILTHPLIRASASSAPPTSPTTSTGPGTSHAKRVPGLRRRQEPRHRPARRRHGRHRARPRGRRLRLRRRALHGPARWWCRWAGAPRTSCASGWWTRPAS